MVLCGALAYGLSFQNAGYIVDRQYQDSGINYADLTDAQGHELTVGLSSAELTNNQAALLKTVVDRLYDLQYAKVENLKVVFTAGRVEIVLIPSTFSYNGMDLAQFMPSGMQFYYTDFLEYDFRLRVNQYFLRFAGRYTDEKAFADRLVDVVKNPTSFLRSQDPEYMLQRLDTIEKALGDSTRANRETLSRVAALAQQVTKLQSQLDAADSSHDALARQMQLLEYGVMVLHNRGWLFGTIYLPDRRVVEKAIEMKKANPTWTKDELAKEPREGGVQDFGKRAVPGPRALFQRVQVAADRRGRGFSASSSTESS